MELDSEIKKTLIEIQNREITEHLIYKKISEKTTDKNSKILKQISEDELRHYNEWKKYTKKDTTPSKLTLIKYWIIAKIFGLMFMMKLLEGNEE